MFVCAVLRMTNIYVSGKSRGIPGSFFVSHSCDTPNIPNKYALVVSLIKATSTTGIYIITFQPMLDTENPTFVTDQVVTWFSMLLSNQWLACFCMFSRVIHVLHYLPMVYNGVGHTATQKNRPPLTPNSCKAHQWQCLLSWVWCGRSSWFVNIAMAIHCFPMWKWSIMVDFHRFSIPILVCMRKTSW